MLSAFKGSKQRFINKCGESEITGVRVRPLLFNLELKRKDGVIGFDWSRCDNYLSSSTVSGDKIAMRNKAEERSREHVWKVNGLGIFLQTRFP
jgi:hypothetical protein